MVKRVRAITSLGRSGVSDFLLQRVSAIIMLAYVVFLTYFWLAHMPLDYTTWKELFSHLGMRIFSLLTLLGLLAHAWIGIWTILTDYVKGSALRGTLQILIIFAFIGALAWGVQILWS